MAAANDYAPEFIAEFYAHFAVEPRSEIAHRPLLSQDDLTRILTIQETRALSKNLTFNYQTVVYQIQTTRPSYLLRKATVVVRENAQGGIAIVYNGKWLNYT